MTIFLSCCVPPHCKLGFGKLQIQAAVPLFIRLFAFPLAPPPPPESAHHLENLGCQEVELEFSRTQGANTQTHKEPRAVETRSLLDEECGNFAVRPAHAQHGKGQRSSHQQPAAPSHDASLSFVIDQKISASSLLDQICHCTAGGAFRLGAGTDQWVRNHKKAPHKTDGQTLLQSLYSANIETLIPISSNYLCKEITSASCSDIPYELLFPPKMFC